MVKSTILKKVVSLTLSVVFLFFSVYIPDTAYAQAGSNTPLGLPHAPVYHIDNITIPKESGNIRESHQGTNGKFIVNIQDAHVNYEGQKNLSAILKELIRDYGISLVLVEGGTGDVGLSFLRHFSTKKRREKIADKYLKKGKIAGEEYLDIVSDPDLKFQIYGIEDKYLYKTNLKQFLRVDKFREKAARFTDSINNALEILKDNLYSDELKGFDKNRRAYEEADLDIVSYCKYLVSIVPGGDQIEKLLNIERLEKAIDFDVVTAERDDYITALSKRLIHNRRAPLRVPYDGDKFPKDRSYDEDKLNELLKEALDFKSGLISPKEFYAYIKELGDEAGMDMKEYPNLHIYTYYIEAFDDIDHDRLFKEIAGLEDEAGEALCKDDTQRKIRETAKKLSLIRRFVNLQLSPADLKEYSSGRKGFDLREWVNFINDTAKKYNLKSISVDYNPIINKNLRKPEAFYRIAKKRDKAFFNNAIKVMEKRGEEKAVIIAGGFHTEHLMPLFKDKGFSYVVVTPKIARKSDYGLYRSLLRNEMSIEEKVMEAVFDSLRGAALLDPSREAALEVILREIIFERGFLNSELVSQPLADFIIAMCQTAPDGVIATGIRAIEDVDLETQKITVLLNDGTRRIFLMNELRWREVTTDPSGAAPKKRQQTTTPVRKIHEGIGCKPGESIMIGPDIQVKVINIKGKTTKKAKLKFVGVPADVTVYRAEEYGKIEKDPAGKIRDYTFSCRVNEGFVLVRGNTKIRVWISFIGRDGKKAWLGTDTPKGISVLRKETFDRIAADASAATDASGAAPGKVDNIGDVVIRRARGQSIMIGPDIEVKVLKIKGKTAKRAELAFVDAPGDVVIYRGEEFGIKKKKPRRKGGTYALERREGQCAVLVRGDDEIRVWISYIEERVVGIATDAPEGIRVVQKENFDRSTSDASKTTPEEIEYPGGLTLTRKPNESIMIGPDIEVKHLGVRGVAIKRAQLLFLNVPADVVVYRGEEYGRKTKRPQEKSGNYRLDRRRGQTVVLVRGDAVIIVRINEIKGPRVWIGTAAPIDMPIVRKEIYGGAATTDASGAAPAESGNFHTQAFGDTFWDDAKFGTRDLETDPVNIYVSPNPLVRTVTEHDPVAGKVRKINLGSIHLPEILNHPTKGPQMIASIEQLGGRITQRLRDAYGGDAELKYLIWPGMGGSIEDKYAAQAAGALGETIRFFGLDDVNRDTIGAIFNEIALTEQGIDPALSYEDALTKGLKQTTVVAQALGMTSYEPVFNADHGLKSLFTQRGLELQNHFWKITLDGSYVDVSLEGCERLPHQPDGAATTSGRHDFMTNGMLIPRYLSGRPIKSWVKAAKLSRYDREQARELAQWIVENERGNLDKIVLGLPEEWQGRFKALPHGIEWRDASLWIKQHFEETLGKTRRVGLNIVTNDSLDIAHCHPADSPRNDKTFLIIKVRGLKNVSDDKIAELQRAGYKVKILYFIDPATRFQVIDGSILARVMQTINYAKFDVARAWGLCAVDQPAVDFYKKIVDWMRLGAKNFTDMVASMFPPLSTSIIYDNQVTNNGITLNWTTMIQRGLLTEEELDMEISALDLDKSRPAHIAAAIHRIALRRLGEDRRPEIQYGELTYYGDLSRTQTGKAMRELLMKYGDGGLWHGVLKSFAAVGKGPGMGHGYHAMIKAHQRVLTTSIIARRYAPSLVPGLETYPEDYQVQHMLGNALALAGYDIEVGDGQELQEGRLVATEEPGWVMSIAIDENNQEARQALVGYFKEVSDILTRHPVVPAVPPQPARRTDPSGAAPAVLSEKTVTLTTETGKNLHILGDGYNILLDDVRRHFGAKQARFRISCIVLDDLAKERSMPPAWFIEGETASTPKEVGMYVEAEVLEVRPEENLVTLKVTKFGPAAEGSETAQRDTDASGIAPEEKIAIDGDILEINRDHQTGYTVVKNRANRIWLFDPRGNVIFENIDASRGFEFTQTHLATRNGEDRLTLRDIKTGDIVFKNIDVSRGFRLTQTHLAIWNIGDRLTLRDIRTKNILFENEDIDASGGLELTQTHLATRNRGGRLTLRDIKAGDIVFEDIDASMGFRLTQTHLATRNGGARLTLRDIETEDIVFKNIDASRDFSLTQTHLTTRNKEGRLTLRDIKTEDIVFEDIDASSGFRLTQTHLATRNGEDRLTLRDIKTGDIVFKNIDVYYGFRFTQTHLATRNKGGRLTLRDIKTKDIVFQNIDASRSFRLTQTHLATCNIKGRLTLIDIKTGDIVFEDIDAYGDFGLTQTHLTTCNRGGHTTIRNIETKEVITPSNLVTYLRTSTATPPSSKTDASGAAPEIVVATNETETHDALLGILKKMNPSANGNDARNCLQRLNRLNGLGQDLIGGTFVYVEGLPLWIAVYGTYGALKLAVINIASEEILVNGIHIDGLDEYSYLRGYLYVTTGSEQYAFRVRPSGIVPPQQYPYPLTLNIRRRETDASGAAPAVLSEKTVTLTTDVGKNLHILGDGYDILLDDVRRHFGAEQARFRVSCIVLDDLAKERSMPPAWFIEGETASTPKEVGMYVEAEVLEVDSEKNLVRLKVTRFGPATGGSRTAQGETDASGAAPGRKKAETERVETSGRMLIVTLPNGKVIRAWKASGFIRQWNKIGYEGILARPPVMHGDNEVNLWMPKEDGTLYYLNGFSMNFPLWRIIQAINYAFALQETIILDTTTDASGAAPVETDKAKVERVIAALQRAAGPVDSESTTAALELSRMASTVRSWVEEGDYINAAEMLPQSEDDLHAWFSQDIVYRMYRDAEAQLAESTTDASGAAPVLSEETVTLTTETGKDLYILGDGYDILLEGVRRYFGVKQARFRITFMQLDTAIKEYSMSPAWFIEGEVANTPRESGMYVEAEVLEVRPEEKQVTLKVTKFGPATEDSRAAQRETDPSGAAPKKKGLKVTAIGKDKGDLIIGFSDKSSIRVSDNDELASELYKKFEGRGIRIIHASDAETSDDAIRLNYYIGNQMRTSRFPFNKECGLDLISGTINRALNDAVNLLGFEEGILRVDWNGSILNVTLPDRTKFTSENSIELEAAWNEVCHRGIKATTEEIERVVLHYSGHNAAPDYLGPYLGSFDHFSPDPTKIAEIINNALNRVEEHEEQVERTDPSGVAPGRRANPFLAELKRLLSEMTIGARQGDQRRGQGIEVVIDPTWHDAANTMNVLVAVFVFEAAEVNWEGTQIAIIDEGTGEVVAMQPLNKKGDTHFKGLESGRPYRLGVVDETAQDVEKIRVISVDPGGNKNSVVIGFNKGVPEVSGKTFAELAGSLNVLLNPRGVRAKAIDAPKAMIRPWHRRPVYAIEISYFNGKKFVYGGTFIGEPAGIINEALEKAVVPPSTTDTDPSGAAPDGKKAGTARVEKRGKTLVVTLPKTKPIRVQTVSGFIRQWNKIGYKSIEAWPVHGENDKVALWMFDEDNLIYLCDFSIYDAPQHIEIGINHALEEASTLETSTDPSGAAPGKRANPFVEDLTRFLSEMVVCEGHANFRQNDRMVVTTYVTAHEAETPNEAGTREIDLVAVAGRYGATYDIPNEAETGGIPHKAETGKIDVIVAAHAFGATDAGWKGTQIGIIDRETGEVVATQPLNVVGRADFRELDGNGEYVFMVVKEPAQGEAPSATTDASGAAPIAQTIPTMVGRLSRVVSEELRHTLEASHGFRSAPKETRASYGRGLTDAGFMTRIYTALERRFTALAQEGEEPELSLTQYDRYITRYEDVQMAAAVLFEITMPQSGPPVTERIPRQLYESGGKLWRETVESLNERAGREAYKLNYDLNLEALDTSSAEKLARDLLKQLNGSDKRYTVLYLPLWIVKILENDKERPLVGQLLERATLISYNDGGAIGDKFIVPEGLLAWGDIWRMIRFEKNVNRYFGVARSLYSALTGGKVLNRENVELIFSDPFGCLIRVFIDFPEIDAELQKWINGHGHDRLAIIELELAV